MKKINSKAFSLVELSFSLVIIGVMIAGIVGGSVLIQKAKLATAQSLTKSSPVASTPGLRLWAETSLDDSLKLTSNNAAISQWRDINPQSKKKFNINAVGTLSYKEKGINDLPSLNFNPSILDTPDYIEIPEYKVINNINFTIFLVDQPSAPLNGDGTLSFLMSGGDDYQRPLEIKYLCYLPCQDYTSLELSPGVSVRPNYRPQFQKTNIHTIEYNKPTSYSYWRNGGSSKDLEWTAASVIVNKIWIGKTDSALPYRGMVSEIIIFDRALSNEERQDIEAYLGKKYDVPIS